MTETAIAATVQREITVKASPARAFDFFTQQMVKWWPGDKHIAPDPFVEIVMEQRTGGRWFERAANGSECSWGQVLDWDPPAMVALSWHLNAKWQFDPDPAHASRVEIRFEPVNNQSTRVVLEHSGIERHGEGYQAIVIGVGSPGGWTGVLTAFGNSFDNQ